MNNTLVNEEARPVPSREEPVHQREESVNSQDEPVHTRREPEVIRTPTEVPRAVATSTPRYSFALNNLVLYFINIIDPRYHSASDAPNS